MPVVSLCVCYALHRSGRYGRRSVCAKRPSILEQQSSHPIAHTCEHDGSVRIHERNRSMLHVSAEHAQWNAEGLQVQNYSEEIAQLPEPMLVLTRKDIADTVDSVTVKTL